MSRVSKRYKLSKKEIKNFIKLINNIYNNFNLSKKDEIEYVKINNIEIYLINNKPIFYKLSKEKLIPILLYLLKNRYEWLPRVIVDRGATRAVGRGADLMVPGIRALDEFNEGDVVVIVDEETRVPVAVGIALLSSEAIRERLLGERKGKAIKTIHYPGDKVWEAAKLLEKS